MKKVHFSYLILKQLTIFFLNTKILLIFFCHFKKYYKFELARSLLMSLCTSLWDQPKDRPSLQGSCATYNFLFRYLVWYYYLELEASCLWNYCVAFPLAFSSLCFQVLYMLLLCVTIVCVCVFVCECVYVSVCV